MSEAAGDLAPMLERRRIEAEILAHVYETLKEAYGIDAARRVIGETVRRSAVEQGRAMAQARNGANPGGAKGLRDFEAIQPLWTRGGALEVEMREASEDTFAFDVKRCRYAEMYRDMGLAEIGPLLSCQRDASFCEGFDPKLKLTRTQTLMTGGDHCDFRYRYEAE